MTQGRLAESLSEKVQTDLLERIKGGVNKGIRQQRDAKQSELKEYKERNRVLRAELEELKAMLAKIQSQNATLIRKNIALSNASADGGIVTQLIYKQLSVGNCEH